MSNATHKDKVTAYLEEQPLFRERKNKDRGIVNLLMRKYYELEKAVTEGLISKDVFVAMVQDYASMDRQWRKTLEERTDLRGTDYDEKDKLEEKKLVELGYRLPPAYKEPTQENRQDSLLK